MIEWTDGQADLIKLVKIWYRHFTGEIHTEEDYSWKKHPQWFAYSGAAGCGKTLVCKEILNQLGLSTDYIGCAYTGKAVLQLLKNEVNAKTIHKLIYDVVPTIKINPKTKREYLGFTFQLKEKLDRDYRLIVVDEATMVNDDMAQEILSFGVPVIFIGDRNQLPPVFGRSSVMDNPDYTLTKIMRQSENNPIIRLSQMVLKGIPILEGDYGNCHVMRHYELGPQLLHDYDQILCVTNKLRSAINDYVRYHIKGYPVGDTTPRLNDKVICRQNDWDVERDGYYLTNGTSGIITDINRSKLGSGYYIMDFHPDYFDPRVDFEKLEVDARYIKADYETQRSIQMTKHEKFEYSYAITVHLSQGSEYPRVLFFDSFFQDFETTKKAEYTAITRARESVDIVIASKGLWK